MEVFPLMSCLLWPDILGRSVPNALRGVNLQSGSQHLLEPGAFFDADCGLDFGKQSQQIVKATGRLDRQIQTEAAQAEGSGELGRQGPGLGKSLLLGAPGSCGHSSGRRGCRSCVRNTRCGVFLQEAMRQHLVHIGLADPQTGGCRDDLLNRLLAIKHDEGRTLAR